MIARICALAAALAVVGLIEGVVHAQSSVTDARGNGPADAPAVASPARAAGNPEEASHASREPGVGWILAAGLHTGLATGLRVGLGDVGIELVGGYQPLVAIWRESGLQFDSSQQLSAEIYLTPWHPKPTSSIGLKGGYRYNSVLEHGYAFALTFLVAVSESIALEVLLGCAIFPGSEGRLGRAFGVSDVESELMYGSNAQILEYGFELIWYP